MKLKNNTTIGVTTVNTIVLIITSTPPITSMIPWYQRKLTNDNDSHDGIAKYGSNDAHTSTTNGSTTAKSKYNPTNIEANTRPRPSSKSRGRYPFPVTTTYRCPRSITRK